MQGTQQSLRKGTILSGNSYNYKIEGILGQGVFRYSLSCFNTTSRRVRLPKYPYTSSHKRIFSEEFQW